jgi:hypothetical protein
MSGVETDGVPPPLLSKKEETRMKLTQSEWLRTGRWMGLCLTIMALMGMALPGVACAQAVSTTTVQGTVYLANGQAGAGTLDVSWPAFTTANGQAIAAGRISATIGQDGFVSVNLAPNLGATPAGLYYTAVYQMSNGSTSTEYWVVPAAAQASLGQVRAQVMPSSQAVQAVSKAYVDQAITELTQSLLTASGGTLSGPLYLNSDPTQPLQAADKHYVDSTFNMEVPIAGGTMTGPLATPAVNGVQSPVAGSPQTTLQAAVSAAGTSGAVEIPPAYAGTDSFTNPSGVYVTDLRPSGAQQFERSVKEFGAVCDGTTDDTSALQTALNYAQTHGVALTIPQGTCKTRTLSWHGESIGGMGKQVSALMGFPGQDVLATAADSTNLLSYTHLHDLTIYVDQSVDVSCSAAQGRAAAGSCAVSRLLEKNSIFAPGGNGLTGTAGIGAAWAVGNCAIAMPAATGAGGNGLHVAEVENLEIAVTGTDPMAAQYPGAHSTHTCAMYLAQWPQWSEFRNIDIRGLNTGIAIPALPVAAPAGLNADSNRWQNITIQATHAFTAAAGSNNVLDSVVAMAANSAATAEPPTGLVLDLAGAQQAWTVRNAVVLPSWIVVPPSLAVTASGGAVTGVTVGSEHGLGFDPYGTQVPLTFSGSCTAQAAANVKSDGSIGTISVTQGGVGCSGTTAASVSAAGTWDTAAPVNLIAGQSMVFLGGNLLKGNGGYTVWNAASSQSTGTQLGGGGGTLPGGGTYGGLVANSSLGTSYLVDQFPGADFGVKLQACLGAVSPSNGGTCDARNFTGSLSMASNLTISAANATVLLPCATISTASQVIVTAGTRNVALRGCALRGASTASGSQGGTVFLYSGTGAMVQVGDRTYAADTLGFHMDNVAINTTAASSATAQALTAYRTQELDLESLYFLGNSNQTGMTLDGTGNYTGGTFFDNAFNGFQTAVNAIGHQAANPATTDWLNASTFVRLHIDCPTSAGNPIAGTYGINLQQGDGNTFTGGDVEGCSTALHLGTNAQNNTIVGLRNENSSNQVVADAGSSYNNWMSGGTMFTGQLTDNGTRNSFLDTFHRSFNGLNGDWYGSQKDATLTNHYRIGIGAGNERGLLNEIQTDYGYRWIEGYSDATAGEQFYQVQDLLNNVPRLSIGQYNNGQSSTNNQTVLNAAGTGAIVLNGSNNSGTGGVVIGSGGASESTVATISNAGNAQFNGTLQVGGASTFAGSTTVKNQVDAEIDQFLWAGATTSQKESFIYKDWNGNSQWYMVKDASNNWALNSATGGLDSFKAYQNTNSGDTYINASSSSGVVRVNYETGSGAGFNIYGGNSGTLYASFTGTASIKFPGLAASTGHNCLQIDNSGYITNTGAACGTGSGGGGTVNSANAGQIAYYTGNGTTIGGMSTISIAAGGTGALTATAALANLGAQAAIPGLTGDGQATPGIVVPGNIAAGTVNLTPNAASAAYYTSGTTDIAQAIMAAAAASTNGRVDATGFAATSYTFTHTLAIPAGVTVQVSPSPNFKMICNVVGAPCVTLGDGGGMIAPGRNSLYPVVIEGSLFNGTPASSAIGSTNLTITGWSITTGVLTVATSGYSGGNLPSALAGQNVTLWGLSEKWLNGLQGNVTGVSGTSFTMAISASRSGSATESGIVQETPFPLVSAASGTGSQESFSLENITISGLISNTNPVGPCLDVQGVFIPTTFYNLTTYYCRGGSVRVHPGTVQRIATDIVFYNLQANDETNVDHPYCNVQIDAMDQTVAGSGVSQITFIAGANQFPSHAPLVCINGNNLGGTHAIHFVGATDWETGSYSGGVSSGSYFTDVTPVQITDASDVSIESELWSGALPAVSGAPAALNEISTTNTGTSSNVAGIDIKNLRWPNASGWPANPLGVLDNVTGVNPAAAPDGCCWNRIGAYSMNYHGTRITDNLALLPSSTSPANPVAGEIYMNGSLDRPSFYDGAQFQPLADQTDLGPYLLGAGDLLAGIGAFSSSSGGMATGWNASGCASPMVCSYAMSTSTYPGGSGSTNTQVVDVTTGSTAGSSQAGISASVNLVAGQTYKIPVWLKEDSGLGGTFIIGVSNVSQGTWYCGAQTPIGSVPTTWTLETISCTANTTVTGAVFRVLAVPAASATGNFYVNYPTVLGAQGFATAGIPTCTIGAGGSGVTACTAGQVVSAIGTTAVTNAANFAGSLSGDVTGTQSATAVVKVNGGAIPTSANVLGSNAGGQLVAAGVMRLMSWSVGSIANGASASGTKYYCPPNTASAAAYCNGTSGGSGTPAARASTVTTCTVFAQCSSGTCGTVNLEHFAYAGFPGGGPSQTTTAICTPTSGSGNRSCQGTVNVALGQYDGYGISVTAGQASDTTGNLTVSCLVQ